MADHRDELTGTEAEGDILERGDLSVVAAQEEPMDSSDVEDRAVMVGDQGIRRLWLIRA